MLNLVANSLPRYTFEDYKQWEGDWELIEGIPVAMAPSPFGIHQKTIAEILTQIINQVKNCPDRCYVYPELDWIIDEETVVRPDIVVICKQIEEYLKEAPEVVIEVVSKSTAQKDEIVKFSLYEREKVNYYVLVYPNIKKVRIFALKEERFAKVFDGESGQFEFVLKNGCTFLINIDEL